MNNRLPLEIPHQPGEPRQLWRRPPRADPPEDRPTAERLAAARAGTHLRTEVAERALATLRRWWGGMLTQEGRQHALLMSAPANGATSLVRGLDKTFRMDGRGPVVQAASPVRAEPQGFIDSVLAALGHDDGHSRGSRLHERERLLHELLVRRRPTAIVVDRAENLLLSDEGRRKRSVGLMLHLAKRTQTPLILVVPPRLGRSLMETYNHGITEPGLWTFAPVPFPRMAVDEAFLSLLDRMEDALPLRRASDLAQREIALHLFALSDGKIGVLTRILREAAVRAIESGGETISLELLDELGLQPAPSFTRFRF